MEDVPYKQCSQCHKTGPEYKGGYTHAMRNASVTQEYRKNGCRFVCEACLKKSQFAMKMGIYTVVGFLAFLLIVHLLWGENGLLWHFM